MKKYLIKAALTATALAPLMTAGFMAGSAHASDVSTPKANTVKLADWDDFRFHNKFHRYRNFDYDDFYPSYYYSYPFYSYYSYSYPFFY